MKNFISTLMLGAIFLAACYSPEFSEKLYTATNRFSKDSVWQYYRWIGPDSRPGKWVLARPTGDTVGTLTTLK